VVGEGVLVNYVYQPFLFVFKSSFDYMLSLEAVKVISLRFCGV
jgi:hypothetical protein